MFFPSLSNIYKQESTCCKIYIGILLKFDFYQVFDPEKISFAAAESVDTMFKYKQ